MTKLKVDLKNGFLEVEGEESFVREIYGDYKDVLTLVISRQSEDKDNQKLLTGEGTNVPSTEEDEVVVPAPQSAPKKQTRAKAKSMESHKIIGDLNLSPGGKASLRTFAGDKKPDGAGEINAVAVYYLQKVLGVEDITPDHVYTCYKHLEKKVPTALVQSLKDAMRRKGWVDVTDMAKIRVTTAGENFVEHDLPRNTVAPVSA